MDAVPHVAEGGDGDANRLVLVVESGVVHVAGAVGAVHGGQEKERRMSVYVGPLWRDSSLKVNNFFHVKPRP